MEKGEKEEDVQDQQDGKSQFKFSRGFKWFLIILMLLNLMTYSNIKSLSNSLGNHSSNDFNNEISNLEFEIMEMAEQLEDIKQENKWIGSSGDEVIGPGSEEYNLKLKYSWTFNKLENNSQVFLLVKGYKEDEWRKIPAQKTAGLNYQVELDLNIEDNYKTQVLATSSSGEKSQDLEGIYLKDMFRDRYHLDYNFNRSNKSTIWDISINEYDDLELKEEVKDLKLIRGFKIKSVKAKLSENGKALETQKFQKKVHSDGAGGLTEWFLSGETKERLSGKIIIEFNNGKTKKMDFPEPNLEKGSGINVVEETVHEGK